MLEACGLALLVTMGLALSRGILGPTIFDRVLAVNMIGTKTVLLLSVVAFIYDRPDFIDLALAYALINFIGVMAILQFVQNKSLRNPSPQKSNTGENP